MNLLLLIFMAVPFPHFVNPVPMPRFVPVPVVAQVQVTAEVKRPLPESSIGSSPAAEPAANPSAAGHREYRRVGRFRTRQVWVADPPEARRAAADGGQAAEDRTDKAPAPGASPGAGCPPTGT